MKSSTGVSGVRATQSLRKEASFGLGQIVPTHLIILALACVLWWIARDMVSTNRTISGLSSVEYKLADELAGKWRVMTPKMSVTLDVSGPMREINEFEGELRKNAARYSYQYTITPDEMQNLRPDSRHQATLLVDPGKFQLEGGARTPAELNIRLVAGEQAMTGQDQRIRVILEEIVSRPVKVDVSSITGAIPGYSFSREVQDIESLRVVGPASDVDRITLEGVAYVRVAGTSIEDILRNTAQVEATDMENLLLRGSIVSKLSLVPPQVGEVRNVGQSGVVGDVRVKFTFEKQETVPKEGEFDVNITYPGWLNGKKGVQVSGLSSPKIPVVLNVSQDTQSAWPDAVKAVLDLSDIKEDDKNIETVENSTRRRLRLTGMYVSVQVDAERLKAFKPSLVKDLRQYMALSNEITIEWDEP